MIKMTELDLSRMNVHNLGVTGVCNQQVVMFPATVAVASITGFHISTTIFASGLATLCFIFVTGNSLIMVPAFHM